MMLDKTHALGVSQSASMSLWFSNEGRTELLKTTFEGPMVKSKIYAVRGKTPGAYNTTATFQWTSAVQALSVLLLKAAFREKSGMTRDEPLLEGGPGSMASSLDASIYKQVGWLDLFGTGIHGDCFSKRILTRTNPGRRRPGPVVISLNERILPARNITLYLDGQRLEKANKIETCISSIEQQFSHGEVSPIALMAHIGSPNPLARIGRI